jgi:hypothetical protein
MMWLLELANKESDRMSSSIYLISTKSRPERGGEASLVNEQAIMTVLELKYED